MINSVVHTGTSLNPGSHMRLRLDPGEPGVERRVAASNATLAITSQEIRNIHRLKQTAIRDGRRIQAAGIRYSATFVGNRLVITGGETTVTSVPAGSSAAAEPALPDESSGRIENDRTGSDPTTARAAAAGGASSAVDPTAWGGHSGSIHELNRELLHLRGEKTRLENEVESSEQERRSEARAPGYPEEMATRMILESSKGELEKVEREIGKLRLQKIVAQLNRLQRNLTEFGTDNVSLAKKYLKSQYPSSSSQPPNALQAGQCFDCLT